MYSLEGSGPGCGTLVYRKQFLDPTRCTLRQGDHGHGPGHHLLQWKKDAPSGTYRAAHDLAVELILEHKLRFFLTDQRRRGAIEHEDEVWLVNDRAPRMAKAGLERAAVVQGPDLFNRITVERSVRTGLPTVPYPIVNFRTMGEAELWLTYGEEILVRNEPSVATTKLVDLRSATILPSCKAEYARLSGRYGEMFQRSRKVKEGWRWSMDFVVVTLASSHFRARRPGVIRRTSPERRMEQLVCSDHFQDQALQVVRLGNAP